jgi:proteic killer suppression protein
MIKSYKDRETRKLSEDGRCPGKWRAIRKSAEIKLDMLNAAVHLVDLCSPPGNRLEALKGDREGRYSIRINDHWRLCFRWTDEGPEDVAIVGYH